MNDLFDKFAKANEQNTHPVVCFQKYVSYMKNKSYIYFFEIIITLNNYMSGFANRSGFQTRTQHGTACEVHAVFTVHIFKQQNFNIYVF